MPRLSKPLTAIQVRNAKPKATPYKLADSRGLHLLVLPSGSKHWRFRYRLAGKENMFAIGAYPDISLALAREACDDARKLVSEGIHPSHARQTERKATESRRSGQRRSDQIARKRLKRYGAFTTLTFSAWSSHSMPT